MKYIGAHVSASGGVENAPINANNIKATSFALFVKNQRQWNAKPLTENNIQKFKENCEKFGYEPQHILPHDSYLINLGHPDSEKRTKSLNAFIEEALRCEQLDLQYLNFHPGSHLREISEEKCLDLVADSLNKAIAKTKNIIFVIENTAGQGSNLGYKFEHLAYIIKKIKNKKRIGVCLDTCHMFVSGYDIKDKFKEVFEEFQKIIGFKYLKGMHLNDSLKELGSKKDRHENLGKGFIGIEFFKKLMKDKRFDKIPLVLETPNSEFWKKEVEMLKKFEK